MAPPPWVTESLGNILGLDAETINEVIVPDLESYSSEVRLRGHLLDFLGTTPAARAFADRYVSYKFPTIAPPAVTLTPDPELAKPKKTKGDKDKKKSKSSHLGSASASASVTPSSSMTDMAALNAAFGPNGHVYQKRRDDELFPSRSGSGAGAHRSTPGSGTHTPARRGGGAVTITEKASKSKGKERAPPQEEKIWDIPKSDEVKRLEGVIADLRKLQVDDRKPPAVDTLPCFCQARVHPLAPYTPQCAACGLILCAKQPAHASCPSCARPTLGPPALARLIQRVEGDVDTQLEREQQERDDAERARKERLLAESGGGAFPSLQGKNAGKPASAADSARRVLSIKPAAKNGKGKGKSKAVLTTTTYLPHPTVSVSAPAPPPVDDTVPRPRSPPLDPKRIAKELAKAVAAREESDRPWYDPKAERRGETWAYVEPLHVELPGEEGTGRRRKAKKKGLGVDGRVVVGAAR